MEYISCTETARLLRQVLKQRFPETKFSVRSEKYAGGSSIDIRWTDGASSEDVDNIARQFSGAIFDGSIDLQSYVTGIHPETGEPVRFGADYVHTHRTYSKKAVEQVIDQVCQEYSLEKSDFEIVGRDDDTYLLYSPKSYDYNRIISNVMFSSSF